MKARWVDDLHFIVFLASPPQPHMPMEDSLRQIVIVRIIYFRQHAIPELLLRERERKSSHQTTAKDRFITVQSQRRLQESCSRRVKPMAVSSNVTGLNLRKGFESRSQLRT